MPATLFRWRRRTAALLSTAVLSALSLALVSVAPAQAAPQSSTSPPLFPAGSAFSNIAAVAEGPTVKALFWVTENGSVIQETNYPGAGWLQSTLAPAGSADPYADIAAVTRGGGSEYGSWVDVFWVGANGSIDHEFETPGPGAQFIPEAPVAPAGSASQTASLAAVSRASDTWEIFWTEPNGGIEDAYHYDQEQEFPEGGGASGSFQLVAPGSSSPTFQPRQIAAVSRAANTMEVWYIGRDGSIQDRYYYDGSGWNGFTLAPAGSATTYEGAIAAVSRASNTMEVWYIGADNSVQDRYYFDGAGWNGFTLAGANSAQSAIAAVAPSANAMNVTWNAHGQTWLDNATFSPWTVVDQITGAGPPTLGNIVAVSQSTGVNVFWVTGDGAIDEVSP
jgi:Fungal fucose-specific lectin